MPEEKIKEARERKAIALRKFLLTGGRCTRRTVPAAVCEYNGSLHSIVSTLRNEFYFPVQSSRKDSWPLASYWVDPVDIKQFNLGGEFREAQRSRVKAAARQKQLRKDITRIERVGILIEDGIDISDEMSTRLKAAFSTIFR